MRGWPQICSYSCFNLSRRTACRKQLVLNVIRTDLQPASPSPVPLRNRAKSVRTRAGVLTVETALALPLFFFTVLAVCYLFQVMEFQLKLQSALNQTAEQTASYGYLLGRVTAVAEQKTEEILEKTGLFSETGLFSQTGLLSVDETGAWIVNLLSSSPSEAALKQIAAQYMDTEDVRLLRVVGGWDGVNFSGSSLRDGERCVVVTAEYRIRIPFVPEVVSELLFRQNAVCRLHCGDRDYIPKQKDSTEEAEGQVFFVTSTGSVYHRSRDCRYLKITVLHAAAETMETKRNSSGGKYYPCRLCADGVKINGTVYYTDGGSSYHLSQNCSSLKRTILEKTEEEIAGLPPCSYCGQGQ